MPRAAKSRIQVEVEASPNTWSLFKGGFKSVKEAEDWIKKNLLGDIRLRSVRVSGVFMKETKITKR